MGPPRWCFIVCFVFLSVLCRFSYQHSICNVAGCNCTNVAALISVNCTLDNIQSLELSSDLIPQTIIELCVSGGESFLVFPDAFTGIRGLALIRVDSTKHVHFKSQSFRNNTYPNFLLQIQNSERLVIEANAFKNTQGLIEAEISKISTVLIQKKAFSRFLEGKFNDIKSLNLAEEAFSFENQGLIGRHGPVTKLSFHNVVIPSIPRAVFSTALEAIEIQHSEISDVHPEAFTAPQISEVILKNSSIERIQSNAFKDGILMFNFVIIKCNITKLQTNAILGAVSNLTVHHSRITDIETGAINITVASAAITDNEIENFQTQAFSLNNWNIVHVTHNIIKDLHSSFLELPPNSEIVSFTFTDNEIYNCFPGTFRFLPPVRRVLHFDDNFFNQTCNCDLPIWIDELFGEDADDSYVLNSSFCLVTGFLARCFELDIGLMNMRNFSELVCGARDTIVCEPYEGETKVIDTTSTMLLDEQEESDNRSLILGLTLGSLFIVAVSGTIVILLIRGGLWLKRKGYFRNMRYNQNEHSNDDENTIVTMDQSEDNKQVDMPEELTPELLQTLRERLEDPQTHQEACEMIERLYDMFIVDESYTNNNRQEEEAHLYEELGNLQHPPEAKQENAPINILRLMEERFNFPMIDQDDERPALVGEYSEPSDAAVHLYSEVKQNCKTDESDCKNSKNNSMRSNASSTMAFRPLPEKPTPGPSSKF